MAQNTFFEKLQAASYKNVPFNVISTDAEFGRSVVIHEFVQRDTPYIEDTGRKARKFKFEGYVCAAIYNNFDPRAERDELIEVIEDGGNGQLVLPDYGKMFGQLHSVGVKTSTRNGGMVTFSFEFVEAGEAGDALVITGRGLRDTRGAVQAANDQARSAAQDEFVNGLDLDNVQGYVYEDAQAMTQQVLDQALEQGYLDGVDAQAATQQLQGFTQGQPTQIELLGAALETVISAMQIPSFLIAFTRPPVPPVYTTSRNRQRQNQTAFVHFVRAIALCETTSRASDLTASNRFTTASVGLRSTPALVTRNEMVTLRRDVTTNITNEIYEMSSLQVYPATQQALVELRTAAIQHMTESGEHLARTFTTSCCDGTSWWQPMPALMVAYRHYGVLNDDAIIERNEIPNPLFMPANSALELVHDIDSTYSFDV